MRKTIFISPEHFKHIFFFHLIRVHNQFLHLLTYAANKKARLFIAAQKIICNKSLAS